VGVRRPISPDYFRIRRSAFRILLLEAILVSTAVRSEAQSTQPLFTIERSKNANTVHYDVVLAADGLLDAKEPIHVYWVMAVEDGRKAELSWLEKKKAYGVEVSPDASRKSVWMTLIPLPNRSIRVYLEDGKAQTKALIGGKAGHLKRVYIQSKEGGMLPKVQYFELFGTDVATGQELYEKIIPKD